MVCQPKSKNMIEHNIEHKKWDKSFYSMWESQGALEHNSLLAAAGTVLWIWIKFLLFPKKAKIMKEIQDKAKKVTNEG